MSRSQTAQRIAARIAAQWPARRVRLSTGEEASGGGGLAQAVDAHGVASLAALLSDGQVAWLEDEDVSLEVRREGHDAVMRVSWPGGPAYEERFAVGVAPAASLPPPAPAAAATANVSTPPVPAPGAGPRPVTDLVAALHDLDRPLYVDAGGHVLDAPPATGLRGVVPATTTSSLGGAAFREAHGVRAAYIAGAMAGGIASEALVEAMAASGLLSFFGAGGLPLSRVDEALSRLSRSCAGRPWGMNLLHNPAEPAVEAQTVDRYLAAGVPAVSASAYMQLSPAVVRFRLHGIREEGGRVVAPNKVLAKVSRPETAEAFLRPAPDRILGALVEQGAVTETQARLARRIPVAEDVTVEADSGGHTDHRPLVAMLPVVLRLRDRIATEEGYAERGCTPRIGAAGGIGDPISLHGALALGADYVLTGSVNQATVEAGTSPTVKEMLAQAGVVDVATGAAPDMFELGAHVQVLSRGSMYAQRSNQLYALYKAHDGLDELPEKTRAKLEKQVFRRPLAEVWDETRAFWQARDPDQVARAERDPRHKMALCFRWYLGLSSRWARTGDDGRKRDFQIWCGPSMGLFNDWVAGSWLAPLPARTVVTVADALLHGAAVHARAAALRGLGIAAPASVGAPYRR